MLLSNRHPQFLSLHRTQEILYGHITEFWGRVDVSACVDMNRPLRKIPLRHFHLFLEILLLDSCGNRCKMFLLYHLGLNDKELCENESLKTAIILS